jgi:hypothetical protein
MEMASSDACVDVFRHGEHTRFVVDLVPVRSHTTTGSDRLVASVGSQPDGDRAFGRHTRPDPESYEHRNVLASHPPSGHSAAGSVSSWRCVRYRFGGIGQLTTSAIAPVTSPASPPRIKQGIPSSKTANHAVCQWATRPTTSPTMPPTSPAMRALVTGHLRDLELLSLGDRSSTP